MALERDLRGSPEERIRLPYGDGELVARVSDQNLEGITFPQKVQPCSNLVGEVAKALAEPLDTPYATTIAMETKGFGAPIEPTEIETLSARRVDYLWLLLIVAVFVICTVFKFTR